MKPATIERYLRLLGVEPGAPDLARLRALLRAQLDRLPFENVSKIHHHRTHGARDIPSIERYLDGAERFGFGGTCYANNSHFGRLLEAIGYRVQLCGADMAAPEVHVVNVVQLGGRPWLVDAGYAAPLREPMPLDLDEDRAVPWGPDTWVLAPRDADGRSRLDRYRDGTRRHGYSVLPRPRRIEEFEEVIHASFRADAQFMNAFLLARFGETRSIVVDDLTVIESDRDGWTMRTLARHADLVDLVGDAFGMPRAILREILADFASRGDAGMGDR